MPQIQNQSYDGYVGIDVDKKNYSVSFITTELSGKIKSFKIPSDPNRLIKYFDTLLSKLAKYHLQLPLIRR